MLKSSYSYLMLIFAKFITGLTGGVIGITSVGGLAMIFITIYLNLKYNGLMINQNHFLPFVLSGVGIVVSYWLLVVSNYCDEILENADD